MGFWYCPRWESFKRVCKPVTADLASAESLRKRLRSPSNCARRSCCLARSSGDALSARHSAAAAARRGPPSTSGVLTVFAMRRLGWISASISTGSNCRRAPLVAGGSGVMRADASVAEGAWATGSMGAALAATMARVAATGALCTGRRFLCGGAALAGTADSSRSGVPRDAALPVAGGSVGELSASGSASAVPGPARGTGLAEAVGGVISTGTGAGAARVIGGSANATTLRETLVSQPAVTLTLTTGSSIGEKVRTRTVRSVALLR